MREVLRQSIHHSITYEWSHPPTYLTLMHAVILFCIFAPGVLWMRCVPVLFCRFPDIPYRWDTVQTWERIWCLGCVDSSTARNSQGVGLTQPSHRLLSQVCTRLWYQTRTHPPWHKVPSLVFAINFIVTYIYSFYTPSLPATALPKHAASRETIVQKVNFFWQQRAVLFL